MSAPVDLIEGTRCPLCSVLVAAPAHSCHVSRTNYVVTPHATPDEQRAIQALQRRAERAAAQIMAEYEVTLPGVSYDLVAALLAVGWIEGRQAGGDEARQVLRDEMARLGGLHSVSIQTNAVRP